MDQPPGQSSMLDTSQNNFSRVLGAENQDEEEFEIEEDREEIEGEEGEEEE